MPIIRKQRYPVPPGSELSRVGRIWVLESLGDDDRHTGIAIREHLRDLFIAWENPPEVTYRDIASGAALFAALEEVRADVERTGRYPILDIECHGFDDHSGVALRDGSGATWAELKPHLQAINLASRFNLVLIMACCSGGYFSIEERLHEPATFLAYLGPTTEVDAGELERALKAFFTALFDRRDVSEAINAMNVAQPGFPYVYMTAEGVFRDVGEGYLRTVSSTRARRARARAWIINGRRQGEPRPSSVAKAVTLMEAAERQSFAGMIRSYFALDAFPENAERFPVDYWQIWRAAQRPRGS
jgi:hypothetical protein